MTIALAVCGSAAAVEAAAPAAVRRTSASRPASPRGARAARRTVPSAEEIRRAVRQLSHPVHARRRAAVRKLAAWGPIAFPELRRAASGSNLEAALSARDLLAELESALLIGARVRLSVDRDRIAWDEPIGLTVEVENPSAGPIRVPWRASEPAAASAPADAGNEGASAARQVGAMFDVADWLIVVGPGGKPVELRTEPIARDPHVQSALELRASDRPPSHQVPAGGRAELRVPAFNRGWARYPMLDAGTYTIALAYQPEWTDPTWTRDGFGRVEADPIHVTITQAAPPAVREHDRRARLVVERKGNELVARLVSTWDFPEWFNLNLGGEIETHGRLVWQVVPDGADENASLEFDAPNTGPAYQPALVQRLDPGASLVAARVALAELRRRLDASDRPRPDEIAVGVRYVHLPLAPELREQLRSRRRAQPVVVPTHLFSGSISSEPIVIKGRELRRFGK